MSDGAATLAARFAEELARDRIADAYLLVGNAASVLEEAAFACAATLLEAQGDVRQHADLVVFDPETIAANAVYGDPYRQPTGLPHVIVGGRQVVANGVRIEGRYPGKKMLGEARAPE